MIDVHVHLAAFPDGKNGCHISDKMRNSFLFQRFFRQMGIDPNQPEEANRIYKETLVQHVRDSRHIQQAVLLAMDGVYDAQGRLDPKATEFVTANDYVFDTVRQHPDLFRAGASINPQRRDAVDELDRCVDAGATLVKVLPNAQSFNPANPAYQPFWRRLAQRKIPLLSHVGYEFSLIGQDQSVGDPSRLRPALEAGVTVIAAHGVSFGLVFYEKYWRTFQTLVKQYPNFYWDASALSLPNRAGMLLRIRRHPELWPRMVFGTDYPLPVFAFPALLCGKWTGYRRIRRERNPFDRHYRLLEALGLPIKENLAL